eukprot:TRINITY_DN3245_c0_g1_i1.p1 TRINITY_DN3245_c0_g1~~TRINITY_DN3245_c0_g1_i1.p1  ORF type:complete len:924 (+),score=110.38 TRINITY_DN3245_c0_g1_i1:5756-8527(+)
MLLTSDYQEVLVLYKAAHNKRPFNMSWIYYILILAVCVAGDNPYYVDESSVHKDTYKWTMKLVNREADAYSDTANPVIREAATTIESLDKAVLHLKIVDANEQRWEAPLINPDAGKGYSKVPMDSMGFEYTNDPFGFKIVDPNTREIVVDMSPAKGGSLQFFDKYLEIGMWFQSQRIFGIGERVTEDFVLCPDRDSCSYTLWGKDVPSPIDDGSGGCKGTYGQQPFHLIQFHNTKHFMGFFILNSNDQDAILKKVEGDAMVVTRKLIGGVFDMYFFYPGTAESVLKNYHDLVGRPYLPPFWSLGFHQCRYGWRSLDKVKEVLAKFEETDIPLEVLWADIDYMKDYADFTVDPDFFFLCQVFVIDLHRRKMRWVPIVDAGLKYDLNDKYYKLGEENQAFIKSAFTKKTLIAAVWPGSAVFLSWYAPFASKLWKMGLEDLYKQVEFDGIWLDMNEPASFCRGECPPKGEDEFTKTAMLRRRLAADPHDPKEFDDIPYRPGNCDITDKTLSMSGYHHSENDYEDRVLKEYNTHSLWNLYEAKATHEFIVEKLKTRPFILTRSNFPGSGIFATKWLGDNHARWEFMRYSIVGLYNYQLFGIPFVGADMCGFMGDTEEELCGRWMQLGAFYPFSRNHNDIHSHDQEPYVFGDRVATASRNAIRQKYSILRYYYTKLFEVSLNGGSLIRPLFFEFPNDGGAYEKTKFMFMIGPSILIPPVLHPGLMNTYPYCTNEDWYNLKDFTKVYSYNPTKQDGEQITLPAGFDYMNVLLRGGSIIPYQDALKAKVRRTEALKVLPMEMIVAPDHDGNAEGSMMVDDGVSLDPIKSKAYRYMKFAFSMSSKKFTVNLVNDWDGEMYNFEEFSRLTVFGAEKWSSVRSACLVTRTGRKVPIRGNYDGMKKNLSFYVSNSDINWRDITEINFDTDCQHV